MSIDKKMKRSAALGALMVFAITGSVHAAGFDSSYDYDGNGKTGSWNQIGDRAVYEAIVLALKEYGDVGNLSGDTNGTIDDDDVKVIYQQFGDVDKDGSVGVGDVTYVLTMGDINEDGRITCDDVTYLQTQVGDVTGDGEINALDASEIRLIGDFNEDGVLTRTDKEYYDSVPDMDGSGIVTTDDRDLWISTPDMNGDGSVTADDLTLKNETPDMNGDGSVTAEDLTLKNNTPDMNGDGSVTAEDLTLKNNTPDMNGDGSVTAEDLTLKNETPDMNGDGSVTAEDLTLKNETPDMNGDGSVTAEDLTLKNNTPDMNGDGNVDAVDYKTVKADTYLTDNAGNVSKEAAKTHLMSSEIGLTEDQANAVLDNDKYSKGFAIYDAKSHINDSNMSYTDAKAYLADPNMTSLSKAEKEDLLVELFKDDVDRDKAIVSVLQGSFDIAMGIINLSSLDTEQKTQIKAAMDEFVTAVGIGNENDIKVAANNLLDLVPEKYQATVKSAVTNALESLGITLEPPSVGGDDEEQEDPTYTTEDLEEGLKAFLEIIKDDVPEAKALLEALESGNEEEIRTAAAALMEKVPFESIKTELGTLVDQFINGLQPEDEPVTLEGALDNLLSALQTGNAVEIQSAINDLLTLVPEDQKDQVKALLDRILGTTSEEIQTALKDLEGIDKNLAELVEFTETVQDTIDKATAKAEEVTGAIDRNISAVEDKVQQKVAALASKFNAFESKLEQNLAAVEQQVVKNLNKVDAAIESNLKELDEQLQANVEGVEDKVVAGIKDTVKELNGNLQDVAGKIEDLEEKVDNFVENNDAEHGKMESAIATNATNIATNAENIATNATNIATNAENIATNAANIATNADNITTNAANIQANTENIATNAANIKTNAENIATNAANIATNAENIATNAANIATNETAIGENEEAIIEETEARIAGDEAIRKDMATQFDRLDNRMDDVADRTDEVGAMAAAIASLHSMGYDPEAPSEIAIGLGQYRDKTGIAIGAFHYPNRDFMLNLSVSTAGDEFMGNVGATWRFGGKKITGNTFEERVAKAEALKAAAQAARAK